MKIWVRVKDFIKVSPPHQSDFFKKNSNNPKITHTPSKGSIGGPIKDILKIDTVASLQCCQFL